MTSGHDIEADAARAAADRVRVAALDPGSNGARILDYLVSETIAGRADRIKAVTIAQDVLGRGDAFDPSTDSTVRVEMKRLRERLAHHYATAGATDPLRIEIPKGTYVPRFVAQHEAAPERPPRLRRTRTLGLAAVLGLGALGGAAWTLRAGPAALASGEPEVAVEGDPMLAYTAGVAREALSRFHNLVLLDADEGQGTYRLELETFEGDAQEVFATLVHAPTGEVIASAAFALTEVGALTAPEVPTALRSWIGRVARPEGVLETDAFLRPGLRGDFACSRLVRDYFAWQTDARHAEAMDCVAARRDRGAETARVWTDLAFLEREAFTDRRGPDPETALERALAAARLAVAADPLDPVAHYALMTALYVAGADAEARGAGERALALNPFDGQAHAGFAMRLAARGEAASALEHFETAQALSPGLGAWADYGRFLAEFGVGDLDAAARTGLALRGSENALHMAALAIGAHRMGRKPLATAALAMLAAQEPDLSEMFARRSYHPGLTRRLVEALTAAGA